MATATESESRDAVQLKAESKPKPKSAKFPRSRRFSCESADRYGILALFPVPAEGGRNGVSLARLEWSLRTRWRVGPQLHTSVSLAGPDPKSSIFFYFFLQFKLCMTRLLLPGTVVQ